MVTFTLYSGRDGSYVDDLKDSIVNMSYTVGMNGVFSGNATLDDSSPGVSEAFTDAYENKYFIKVGVGDTIYGGVLESCSMKDGVWKVIFVGAAGWWDKMDAVSSLFARGASVQEGTNSGVVIFYSESPLGILYEVFKNQAESMVERGWVSSVIDFSQLIPSSGVSGQNWKRSYRLNSFETPTFASVVNDIIGQFTYTGVNEDTKGVLDVNVNSGTGPDSTFKFIVSIVSNFEMITLDEENDDVFDISIDTSESEYRAFGIATGTNLSGKNVLAVESLINPENIDAAYSSSISTSSSESSDAVDKVAISSVRKTNTSSGSFTFSSYSLDIEMLSQVYISKVNWDDNAWETIVWGTVVEIAVDGEIRTYSCDINYGPSSGTLKVPPSVERSLIFNPLNEAIGLSGTNARRSKNSTGWRG